MAFPLRSSGLPLPDGPIEVVLSLQTFSDVCAYDVYTTGCLVDTYQTPSCHTTGCCSAANTTPGTTTCVCGPGIRIDDPYGTAYD
jgi:hypothetical protein